MLLALDQRPPPSPPGTIPPRAASPNIAAVPISLLSCPLLDFDLFMRSKGLMFHEYYVIPLSWKEMLRKITLHDCEIQVSCVCEENEVGSLTSKKKNLGITDPVSVAATPALPRAWDCGLSGSAAHRCCAGRDCPCFPQVGPDHWGAEGDDILGCGAHCYYAAGRCWRTHTCLALEIVSFWSISRTDITRADFVVGWKMGD
ncbi:uncharacterized protein [Triticum aestivum]|uniref:uncharacterized protein isoform X3 n=1 Tax=Triticum aestivum TaxID=4565 RepID=UPI001D002CA7|nr:uncharacterized protein LOC123128057 isoform X3 [Triticum aestivum]